MIILCMEFTGYLGDMTPTYSSIMLSQYWRLHPTYEVYIPPWEVLLIPEIVVSQSWVLCLHPCMVNLEIKTGSTNHSKLFCVTIFRTKVNWMSPSDQIGDPSCPSQASHSNKCALAFKSCITPPAPKWLVLKIMWIGKNFNHIFRKRHWHIEIARSTQQNLFKERQCLCCGNRMLISISTKVQKEFVENLFCISDYSNIILIETIRCIYFRDYYVLQMKQWPLVKRKTKKNKILYFRQSLPYKSSTRQFAAPAMIGDFVSFSNYFFWHGFLQKTFIDIN